MSIEDAVKELQARPDIDATMVTYNQLLKDVRDGLTAAGVVGSWKSLREGNSGACGDYGDEGSRLNAENRSTPSWSATGIPEKDWPAALAVLKRITAAAGFTTMEVPKDEPGNHDLFIQGPYGAVLDFGTQVNTVMSINSGCHRIPGKPINPASSGSS